MNSGPNINNKRTASQLHREKRNAAIITLSAKVNDLETELHNLNTDYAREIESNIELTQQLYFLRQVISEGFANMNQQDPLAQLDMNDTSQPINSNSI